MSLTSAVMKVDMLFKQCVGKTVVEPKILHRAACKLQKSARLTHELYIQLRYIWVKDQESCCNLRTQFTGCRYKNKQVKSTEVGQEGRDTKNSHQLIVYMPVLCVVFRLETGGEHPLAAPIFTILA